MSHPLIGLNPDLKQLRDEGYEVAIVDGYLVIHAVPYLDSNRQVQRGALLCAIEPKDHTVLFSGEYPHDLSGKALEAIRAGTHEMTVGGILQVKHRFSSKPQPEGRYRDRHHMMTRYIEILGNEARAVDPEVTACTFKPIADTEEGAIFKYVDTASSRANIVHLSAKFKGMKIAIVGLGGTGSYVLDLVAKTAVEEIHLFDGDVFAQHNAYRTPGAPSFEDMNQNPLPKKVDYLSGIYSRMRNGIIPHGEMISGENVGVLSGMNFVFICIDGGSAKQVIAETLEAAGVAFIDTGIGVQESNGLLFGALRATTSTPTAREHVRARVSFSDPDPDAAYASNIQIADLNSLTATLAVIKWKKHLGFYEDRGKENNSSYMIEENALINEEHAEDRQD